MLNTTKNALRSSLLALCLGGAACGGSSPAPVVPEAPPAASAKPAPTTPTLVGGSAAAMPLPTIPADAVEAPVGLMASLILGNPNHQLTDVGVFLDAAQPGMGAIVSGQSALMQLESMVGVMGIGGIDLNNFLAALILDSQQTVMVAKIADEASLRQSMEKVSVPYIIHNGFVAIGDGASLQEVAPYALSNLVTQKKSEIPLFNLHLANITQGKKGGELKRELRSYLGGVIADQVNMGMKQVSLMQIGLETDQMGLKLHVTADVKPGMLRTLIGKQQPAAYTNVERIGTGPWGILAGGRLDLTMLSPMLAELGERSASPLLIQVGTQLGELVGEIGIAVNFPSKPQVAFAMDLTNASATAKLVDVVMSYAAKEKNFTMMDMKTKVKLAAIKTSKGKLHELKFTASKPQQIATLGKKPVSAYWGVMGNSLVGTFGIDAKKNARTLSKANGKMKGKGTNIAEAIALSKSKKESAMVALDIVGLQERRPFKDVKPVVLGVGFTSEQIHGRADVPMEFIVEMMSLRP
ncbi:MAG: hypothetical protein JKY56_08270 [Kofleriaceae bacterium]|nr:hypothetical protein [Kofleriaceae bacterium]